MNGIRLGLLMSLVCKGKVSWWGMPGGGGLPYETDGDARLGV